LTGYPVTATQPIDGTVRVRQARRLRGRVRLPGDKSITHRALILAALADGLSRIERGSDGLDANSTAACLEQLGVSIERVGRAEAGRVDRIVAGRGPGALQAPGSILDCGNSGTTLRLLAGVLAGRPFESVLDGDGSLRLRPVARIIEPLRSMGATLRAHSGDTVPPLTVVGRDPLRSIDYAPPVPSAQVKSAILLAGLSAEGRTTVREPVATRDHTERMLGARGVAVTSIDEPNGARSVSVKGGDPVQALDERIPGDLSAAAFWLVAGAAHPDAELVIEDVGVNPTRRSIIDLLRAMGADLEERESPSEGSEPRAELTVRSSELHGIELDPLDIARAIDEIPVLCLAAACATGVTVIRGAGELRHKESDRVGAVADGLAALGASVEVMGDDLRITGGRGRPAFGLRGAEIDSRGDHRIAMMFAVAGLLAEDETSIGGAGSAAVSDPTFFDQLAGLQR
jgi:3-phosphoshikimate 1-carboxyvinyltransferase